MDLQKIEAVIRPVVEGSGLHLYDLEFVGRSLRISIFKSDGVTLEDCAEVSRLLNPLLDVEDVVPGGRYELEVSSPGLDRRLKTPEHFRLAMNETIKVETSTPMSEWNPGDSFFEGRCKVKGILKSIDGPNLKLEAEGKDVVLPLEAIKKAKVDFQLKVTPKKGKK